MNEKWIKERKSYLLKKISIFEKKLALSLEILKSNLNKELWKLHNKRLSQFDKLSTKYLKCKNMVSEHNAHDVYEIKKLKTFFLFKNDIPIVNLKEEKVSIKVQKEINKPKLTKSIVPNIFHSNEDVIRDDKKNLNQSQLKKKIGKEIEDGNNLSRISEKTINKSEVSKNINSDITKPKPRPFIV